jgi:trigger factor
MATLTTSVEQLEGNKVRLKVAVPAAEFEKALDAAFRKLAREVKIPGFRPGKVPRQLLEARLGGDVAREQALRDSVPGYYAKALADTDLDAIAPPEIDITAGEESGDVEFDAVVELRPVVHLGSYEGLRVEIPAVEITDEVVDAQIDGLRERFADLEEKAGPLTDGDYAEVDVKSSIGGEPYESLSATDYLYEVGSGLLLPRLDDELRGTKAGDIIELDDTLPERFGEQAGDEVTVRVLVKAAKRKVLPDATDEWASEVSEFDTIEELRTDARQRLELYARVQGQMAVRNKVLDGIAALVEIDLPEALVTREMESRLHDLAHRLEAQGATIPQYLEATGQDQQALVATVRQGAVAAVKADLALRAVITQAEIVVTDEDVDIEVARIAQQANEKPEKVRRDLEQRGLMEAIRFDLTRGQALQHLIDHAVVVDESGAPVDLTLPSASSEDPTPDTPEDERESEEPNE